MNDAQYFCLFTSYIIISYISFKAGKAGEDEGLATVLGALLNITFITAALISLIGMIIKSF